MRIKYFLILFSLITIEGIHALCNGHIASSISYLFISRDVFGIFSLVDKLFNFLIAEFDCWFVANVFY
jgi:hypothetical protein